jgi:hypothetical protein
VRGIRRLWEIREIRTKFYSEILKERDNLDELGVDGKII